jgi:hypothetical protein
MRIKSLSVKCISMIILVTILMTSCASNQTGDPRQLRVGGASDVLYLATNVKEAFNHSSGLLMDVISSENAIRDLKENKIDVALVGKELEKSELESLEISPVAYDAVCILIATHTYVGGNRQTIVGKNTIRPMNKFVGLKNLTLDDLRQHYRNILNLNPKDNPWRLKGIAYFSFDPIVVDRTVMEQIDPLTNTVDGLWTILLLNLGGEMTPPGLFDTQSVLLKKLDLSDVVFDKFIPVTGMNIESEELWISSRYVLGKNQDAPDSSWEFNLYLMPASRNVTIRAIEHGFGVKPLSIDDVDPLSSPDVIYNGTYPLSRKIYLVVKKPAAKDPEELVKFLLSAEGQKLVEKARFLPLPSGEVVGNQN